MAGRQGFELGASLLSNVVMACVFWFQALESQAVMSLRFVHCRPPESPRFSARRGDILETVLAFYSRSPRLVDSRISLNWARAARGADSHRHRSRPSTSLFPQPCVHVRLRPCL